MCVTSFIFISPTILMKIKENQGTPLLRYRYRHIRYLVPVPTIGTYDEVPVTIPYCGNRRGLTGHGWNIEYGT